MLLWLRMCVCRAIPGRQYRLPGQWLPEAYVGTTSSRFTAPSVVGLIVGAMGVFVFTVALGHWLGERRKFREEARA